MKEQIREYPILVPHSDYGDPECCGIVMAVEHTTGIANLTCNECGIVVRTVPGSEAERTLLEMSMAIGFCAETCNHCSELNTFPGCDSVISFTCRYCGKGVQVD